MRSIWGAGLVTLVALALLCACSNDASPPGGDDQGPYVSSAIGTLVYVPAGRFQRDATPGNISVVSAFRLSEREITRAQFVSVMACIDPSDPNSSSGTSDPVQRVNWYAALAFCNKLSLQEGLSPVYSVSDVDFGTLDYGDIPYSDDDDDWNAATADWAASGYRLPTHMEWLWAAMGAPAAGRDGGTDLVSYDKAFAGSTGLNAIGDYAWYAGNAGGDTHPTGGKLANELGLFDMTGNVRELCWDLRGDGLLPTGLLEDFRGEVTGSHRIGRGGNFNDSAVNCELTPGFASLLPYSSEQYTGFRVARR